MIKCGRPVYSHREQVPAVVGGGEGETKDCPVQPEQDVNVTGPNRAGGCPSPSGRDDEGSALDVDTNTIESRILDRMLVAGPDVLLLLHFTRL